MLVGRVDQPCPQLETGGHRSETKGHRLETKEVAGWKQKRQNYEWKLLADNISRGKFVKTISANSPGDPLPPVKLLFLHHAPL